MMGGADPNYNSLEDIAFLPQFDGRDIRHSGEIGTGCRRPPLAVGALAAAVRTVQPVLAVLVEAEHDEAATAPSAVLALVFLRWQPTAIPLSENDMVARADHGMIRPGTRSRRGPQMSATPDRTLSDQQTIADLKRQLAESNAERDEALEQQTATADVLQVINSSPGDLGPVFDAMLERAIRLCEATHGHFFNYRGECFHLAAVNDDARYVEWMLQRGTVRPHDSAPLGRINRGERIVHAVDMREEEVYRTVPTFREQIDLRGVRSQITFGLFKDNTLLGAMVFYRQEVRPFSDKQIALLQNFAAQAVIAMENARLITETREALEQQTATTEVLQVINSSPGDLAPVFDAILEKARMLCGTAHASLIIYDGDCFRAVATHGMPAAYDAEVRRPWRPHHDGPMGRLLRGEPLVHIPDMRATPGIHLSAPKLIVLAGAEQSRRGLARSSTYHCARMAFCLAVSAPIDARCDRSPRRRSHYSRTSRRRRSSRWRTRGSSPRRAKLWNSRPQPPRCFRSLTRRRAILPRCLTRY